MREGGTLRMEVSALRAFVRLSYHICSAGERSGVFVCISIFCMFAVTVSVSFFIIFFCFVFPWRTCVLRQWRLCVYR